MKTIVFATGNAHKLAEIRALMPSGITIAGLPETGFGDDLPETADTLEGNALQKARYVNTRLGCDCFADDTGLEVEALHGEPGVRSARYAGNGHDSEANIRKLLLALDGRENRKARFRTVIALIMDGEERCFEGVAEGRIITGKRGTAGFGYDPVFVPDGFSETFAELGAEMKNSISHRAAAVRKLADFLKRFILTVVLLCCLQSLTPQTSNEWKTFLAYNDATEIAESDERVYVLASGSLYSYGKDDREIITYSKQKGLSDADISLISYSPETHTLIIIYRNGNIDLYDKDGIKNVPALKNATTIQSKGINSVYFYNEYAYLSADFGIMVVNLSKKEVADTYKIGATRAVCILRDTIFASTGEGFMKASVKANLPDLNNWQERPLNTTAFDAKDIKYMCLFQDKIFFCVSSNGVYYETPEGEIKNLVKQSFIKNISAQAGQLLVYTNEILSIYDDPEHFVYVTIGSINDAVSLKNDGKYWIASGLNGLLGIETGGDGKFSKFVSDIAINSPKRNYNAFMTVYDDRKLFITGGDRLTNRFLRPGTLMMYENETWQNLDEAIVNREVQSLTGNSAWDYMGVAVDPDDETHYFIATYGEGIIEMKDNEFVRLYNMDNSPLTSSVSYEENGIVKYDPAYVRIGSVCFDKEKNLWSTNGYVRNAVNVLKANGEWVSLYYSDLNHADKIDRILIASNGYKWINVPYDNAGIFVLDERGTIDDTSDDLFRYFTSFKDAQSATGSNVPASQYLCMAEDRNGTIWIGTNIGLLKCSMASRALENPEQLAVSRLVRDGEAYFLSGESVTAIAVDANNQKWIGTSNQGVFLISEDGSETICNFTAENSPLLSNTIKSIAVNGKTGEVFFGTDNGLTSFNSGVRSGATPLSDVYAFPNPVRPEYNDKVTIMGLTNQTNVKITDINGHLIFQKRATGNYLVWNCRNSSGNRVATGVYLVIAATPDASESVVAKIAVVK